MRMINSADSSPDDPVIEALAETLALKEIEHRNFETKSDMGSFHTGYANGFIAGAQFMKTFLRKREAREFFKSRAVPDENNLGSSDHDISTQNDRIAPAQLSANR